MLVKDQGGKLRIKETGDNERPQGLGARRGGRRGGGAGAGPALVVPAAVGALIGGLSAKLRDTGSEGARR
ncbi:MAG: hypothetical protein HGA45_18290 [Chloroflexales bacterium]|nr:hypothetical protein [Chloroflexales bacterium]